MLNDTITFELAKLLDNRVFPDAYENSKYAAEDLEVTFDESLGTHKYKKGEFITEGDNVHGKFYYAPTYAEVLDWIRYKKGYVIEWSPAFTYALRNHIAYHYRLWKVNDVEGRLILVTESKFELSSFELAVRDIVTKIYEYDRPTI